MTDWDELASRFGDLTDKFSNGLTPLYEELTAMLPEDARILEVGVHRGGSIALWKELFPGGTIVGVDSGRIGPQTETEGAVFVLSDQCELSLPGLVQPYAPDGYDMIIDDASHIGSLSKVTFELLWPHVAPGGWYVLEDWGVGIPGNDPYFGQYEGTSQFDLVTSFLSRCGRYPWRADGDYGDISEFRGRPSIIAIRKKKA